MSYAVSLWSPSCHQEDTAVGHDGERRITVYVSHEIYAITNIEVFALRNL
jgi:hypothetical protein